MDVLVEVISTENERHRTSFRAPIAAIAAFRPYSFLTLNADPKSIAGISGRWCVQTVYFELDLEVCSRSSAQDAQFSRVTLYASPTAGSIISAQA